MCIAVPHPLSQLRQMVELQTLAFVCGDEALDLRYRDGYGRLAEKYAEVKEFMRKPCKFTMQVF